MTFKNLIMLRPESARSTELPLNKVLDSFFTTRTNGDPFDIEAFKQAPFNVF